MSFFFLTGKTVMFLIETCTLEPSDIDMNSQTFRWLAKIGDMLEDSLSAITNKRESVALALELRAAELDKLIKEHVIAFNALEKISLGSSTEDYKKVQADVLEMIELVKQDRREAMQVNEEQELLEMVKTDYSDVDDMLEKLEPIYQLFNIVLEFRKSVDEW